MGLLLLAAARGSEIHLEAEGADAEEALTALSALVNRKFDEAA
jgi:phosphocarrier protein